MWVWSSFPFHFFCGGGGGARPWFFFRQFLEICPGSLHPKQSPFLMTSEACGCFATRAASAALRTYKAFVIICHHLSAFVSLGKQINFPGLVPLFLDVISFLGGHRVDIHCVWVLLAMIEVEPSRSSVVRLLVVRVGVRIVSSCSVDSGLHS